MNGPLLVVAETAPDGGLARITTEVATLARSLAAAGDRQAVGLVVAADPSAAVAELAAYLPRVLAVAEPAVEGGAAPTIVAERAAAAVGSLGASHLLLAATPDGRDTAGVLSALLGWGVLANATGAAWGPDGPTTEASVLGGSMLTRSALTGETGILTIRPNAVTAEPASDRGVVETLGPTGVLAQPVVAVTDRVAEAGATVAIEEARIVVTGGRGVGGPEGFTLVRELATALGGAVGATRAAVDSGWINYANQIGQTGKTVKPQLYMALGVSGAIQHKVGMQTAGAIVAINRDPDAPLADFADLFVVGDLFEVVPAILAELRARGG